MKNLISYLCVMACAIFLAACSNSSNRPENVVEKYANYIQNEKYEKIVEITHFNKELTKEQKTEFAQMLSDKVSKNIEQHNGLKSIEITGAEVAEDGATAVVHIIMHYGDGSEKMDDVKTILVDGNWMLDSGK